MMFRFKIFRQPIFVLSAFLAIGASGSVAQNLTGYWNLKSPNPNGDGTFRETYFHIEQSGETLSGELIRKPMGLLITGTFKDGAVHFVTVPPVPPPA